MKLIPFTLAIKTYKLYLSCFKGRSRF